MNLKRFWMTTFMVIALAPLMRAEIELRPIFNGTDFSGWKVPESNIWWKVQNGLISAKSGPDQSGSILWTEKP